MSTRRKPGDWVRLKPGAGMTGESERLAVEIQDDDSIPCFLCEDESCREWATVWTEPDPLANGKRWALCHVSECEMLKGASV